MLEVCHSLALPFAAVRRRTLVKGQGARAWAACLAAAAGGRWPGARVGRVSVSRTVSLGTELVRVSGR